jgi:peptide/nickel transport system ATP-binding protein
MSVTAMSMDSARSASQPLGLRVEDLQVRFGEFTAVEGVSLDIAPGESFGIVGESGSGKSTVLRAVCGLVRSSRGRVALQQRPLEGSDAGLSREASPVPAPGTMAFRRQVQMVFQDPYGSLHPRQTVDRILAEPLAIHRLDDAEGRILRVLEAVGLGHGFRFRYPHQLSGGQRQRVAIARALILEPQILLLDEPTSALDASVQAEVLNLLEQLRLERALTFVMVSHDLAVVTHLCERLLVMKQGRMVEQLDSRDLAAARVQDGYTRRLMQAAEGFRRQAG